MKATFRITFCLSIVFVLLSFFGCSSLKKDINFDDIEHAVLWKETIKEEYTLNEEELKEFIKLYNSASFEGEWTEECGTTPGFGVIVTFKDGSYMDIADFCAHREKSFEIITFQADGKKVDWFYIGNEELEDFVKGKLQQFEEQTKIESSVNK